MINPLNIKDSLENKISYYHLLGFVVTLPFDRFYSQLVFISLFLHTIIHFKKTSLQYIFRKDILVLQSVFLLTVICTTWSAYPSQAFNAWEKQLSILLFPLLLFINPLDLKKYTNQLLAAFGFTCVVVVLYLYTDAFRIIYYYHFPLKKIFSVFFLNHNFSRPIGIHATYLSLFVALSIITFTGFLLRGKTSGKDKIAYLLAICILGAGLLQLASRSVLLAIIVILNCVVPFFCRNRKQGFRFLSISLTCTAIAVFCIVKTEMLQVRLLQGFKNDLSTASAAYSVTNPRAERWDVALQLVKESPVIGFGSGAEIPVLKDRYFENKLYDSYLNELNAHNQYISFLINGGVLALFIFLFTLIWGFRRAVHSKQLVFTSFLILLAIVSVSENILDVNKGIFFYAFFFSFFTCITGEIPVTGTKKVAIGNPACSENVLLYKDVTH
jgi:O-antigen ligase